RRRGGPGRRGGTERPRTRQAQVSRRLRYRRHGRPVRVVIRTRHHRLVYRGRIASLIAVAALTGVVVGTGAAIGRLDVAALVAGPAVAAWLAYQVRLIRPVPAGPRGDGPAPPGGASVREPRRPLPM